MLAAVQHRIVNAQAHLGRGDIAVARVRRAPAQQGQLPRHLHDALRRRAISQSPTASLSVPGYGRPGDRVAAAGPDARPCRARAALPGGPLGVARALCRRGRSCWPTSCRSRPAPTPRHCASTRCAWPSMPRQNWRRNGVASSMAARPNGPDCPSRRGASWSASMAATSATGKTERSTSRSSSAGRCPKTATPVTSVWCMATIASRSADCSTCSRARDCRPIRTSPS